MAQAADVSDDWELCKENVQPLRQGRSFTELSAAIQPSNAARIKQEQEYVPMVVTAGSGVEVHVHCSIKSLGLTTTSDRIAYSAELVLLNKHQIYGGAPNVKQPLKPGTRPLNGCKSTRHNTILKTTDSSGPKPGV